MKSIRGKILILFIMGIVIMAVVVGSLLMSQTKSAYSIEAMEAFEHEVDKQVAKYDKSLTRLERTGYSIKMLIESTFDLKAFYSDETYLDVFVDDILPTIKKFAEDSSKDHSAYIFFNHNVTQTPYDIWFSESINSDEIVRNPVTKQIFYDSFNERKQWYFEPLRTQEPYWSSPYHGLEDFKKDVFYISRTYPVIVGNQVIGVSGSDYYFDDMSQDIMSIKVLKTGYAVLLDNKGGFIVDSKAGDQALHGYVKTWFEEETMEKTSGILEFTSQNQLNYFVYSKLVNGWSFGLVIKHNELFKWYYDMAFRVFIILVIAIVSMSLLSMELSKTISKPILDLSEHVQLISHDDYKHHIPTERFVSSSETFSLAENIEKLRLSQEFSFEKLKKQAHLLEIEARKRTESLKENSLSLEKTLTINIGKKEELLLLNKELEQTLESIKLTQKQLVESERMASLSFIVTRLAHEFNTPIGSFITLLSFLDSQEKKIKESLIKGDLTFNELNKFLSQFDLSHELIHQNLEQMNVLVEQFDSLDVYSHQVNENRINLHEFILIILKSMSYDTDAITIDLECHKDIEVVVDAGKLSQIFIHVIENAIIHGIKENNHGLIAIKVQKNDDNLFITIEDNGHGMTKEKVKQIFVPFYSGELSNRTSGIGLNVVYNLVTKVFDGQIICKSELGKGTTLNMILKC